MIAFGFTLSRQVFDELAGIMNFFTNKLMDSEYCRILHLHWRNLTLRNLSQNNCLSKLSATLSGYPTSSVVAEET